MTNLEKYDNVFMKVFGVPNSVLNENFTFKNTKEWDSVAHLSLISELEDCFDVMFESDDILHFASYENGKAILRRYKVDDI